MSMCVRAGGGTGQRPKKAAAVANMAAAALALVWSAPAYMPAADTSMRESSRNELLFDVDPEILSTTTTY